MFNRIIVPTDGSEAAWRAVTVADRLATQCDAELELLHIVALPGEAASARRHLQAQVEHHPLRCVATRLTVEVASPTIPAAIADHLASVVGGVLVMDSFGRGRTGAVLGSVTTDVLRTMYGPVVVVGPHVAINRADYCGELVVPVDGSALSEAALGLGAAWGIGLGARPWVVTVLDPLASPMGIAAEHNYPARLAREMAGRTRRDAEFEVLHDDIPGRAVVRFATSIDAGLIVASTHGRTGLARAVLGSVAADLVRHARCPVALLRPPELDRVAAEVAASASGRP